MARGTMRLVDASTNRMRCSVCGMEHYAMLGLGGRFKRGSWHCKRGCKVDDLRKLKAKQ